MELKEQKKKEKTINKYYENDEHVMTKHSMNLCASHSLETLLFVALFAFSTNKIMAFHASLKYKYHYSDYNKIYQLLSIECKFDLSLCCIARVSLLPEHVLFIYIHTTKSKSENSIKYIRQISLKM